MKQFLYDVLWKLELMFQRVGCFFVGHDERAGQVWDYEDDYCSRCLVSWPQDKITLPRLLTRLYSWMVERKWRWFERLDDWIYENHRDRLPTWWEY